MQFICACWLALTLGGSFERRLKRTLMLKKVKKDFNGLFYLIITSNRNLNVLLLPPPRLIRPQMTVCLTWEAVKKVVV
jgi:hypothetical protein